MSSLNCCECGAKSIYKCPTCNERYCSVACCQAHKKKQCVPIKPVENVSKNTPMTFLYPTEDTVDIEKLKLLENNQELKNMLSDVRLRKTLQEIDQLRDPEKLLKQCLQNPEFSKFADQVLKTVEKEDFSQSV